MENSKYYVIGLHVYKETPPKNLARIENTTEL